MLGEAGVGVAGEVKVRGGCEDVAAGGVASREKESNCYSRRRERGKRGEDCRCGLTLLWLS